MTIDEIASYCEFKDCRISAGDPQTGFVHLDGTGLEDRSYTYGRFNMLTEVASLPAPANVIETASIFKIQRGDDIRTLDRTEFEADLKRFQRLVNA